MNTPETVNVQAVPTLHGLRHYLDYQYPPTRGDVLLNKICNQIAELERERDEAKGINECFKSKVRADESERTCIKAERDQLRKVSDELAKQLDRIGFHCAGNELTKEQADTVAKLAVEILKLHSSLPHVLERNKPK